MAFKDNVDLLGPILGPKADMCLLMDLHGAAWTNRALATLMKCAGRRLLSCHQRPLTAAGPFSYLLSQNAKNASTCPSPNNTGSAQFGLFAAAAVMLG